MEKMTLKRKLLLITDEVKKTLIEKNKLYGDSALNPNRIMSNLDPSEGIYIRMDDKLNRLLNSPEKNIGGRSVHVMRDNDIFDLMGYCILLTISFLRNKRADKNNLSFKKEIDSSVDILSTPTLYDGDLFSDIENSLKDGSFSCDDEDKFYQCLIKIIDKRKNQEEDQPVILFVMMFFKLCLYVCAYKNITSLKNQID